MDAGSITGGLGGSARYRRLEAQIETAPLEPAAKAALASEVQDLKAQEAAYRQDRVFYRIVVLVLGFAILFVIGAITLLLYNGVSHFDALTAIGSAAVGGLVGLLAPSPASGK